MPREFPSWGSPRFTQRGTGGPLPVKCGWKPEHTCCFQTCCVLYLLRPEAREHSRTRLGIRAPLRGRGLQAEAAQWGPAHLPSREILAQDKSCQPSEAGDWGQACPATPPAPSACCTEAPGGLQNLVHQGIFRLNCFRAEQRIRSLF